MAQCVIRVLALEVREVLLSVAVEYRGLRSDEQPVDAGGRRCRRADEVLCADGVADKERLVAAETSIPADGRRLIASAACSAPDMAIVRLTTNARVFPDMVTFSFCE